MRNDEIYSGIDVTKDGDETIVSSYSGSWYIRTVLDNELEVVGYTLLREADESLGHTVVIDMNKDEYLEFVRASGEVARQFFMLRRKGVLS